MSLLKNKTARFFKIHGRKREVQTGLFDLGSDDYRNSFISRQTMVGKMVSKKCISLKALLLKTPQFSIAFPPRISAC
jgi:hypothetical protein